MKKQTCAVSKLDPTHVKGRIENFFGYGSLESPIWLIGMEDGIDINGILRYLSLRFCLTHNKTTVDIEHGMLGVQDHLKWYTGSKVPIQSTYKNLIRIIFAYYNLEFKFSGYSDKDKKEKFSNFQKESLGRICEKNFPNAVLELMPLPSNSTKDEYWIYDWLVPNATDLNLQSRPCYLNSYKKSRIEKLHNLIYQKNNPEVIICYSYKYKDDWLNVFFNEEQNREIISSGSYKKNGRTFEIYKHYKNNDKHLFIVPHPTATNYTDDQIWIEIAEAVQNRNKVIPKL